VAGSLLESKVGSFLASAEARDLRMHSVLPVETAERGCSRIFARPYAGADRLWCCPVEPYPPTARSNRHRTGTACPPATDPITRATEGDGRGNRSRRGKGKLAPQHKKLGLSPLFHLEFAPSAQSPAIGGRFWASMPPSARVGLTAEAI